eukprot:7210985-Prymnesium_polylepis.1
MLGGVTACTTSYYCIILNHQATAGSCAVATAGSAVAGSTTLAATAGAGAVASATAAIVANSAVGTAVKLVQSIPTSAPEPGAVAGCNNLLRKPTSAAPPNAALTAASTAAAALPAPFSRSQPPLPTLSTHLPHHLPHPPQPPQPPLGPPTPLMQPPRIHPTTLAAPEARGMCAAVQQTYHRHQVRRTQRMRTAAPNCPSGSAAHRWPPPPRRPPPLLRIGTCRPAARRSRRLRAPPCGVPAAQRPLDGARGGRQSLPRAALGRPFHQAEVNCFAIRLHCIRYVAGG